MKNFYTFALKLSLKFSNFLYKLISYLAIKREGGIHPKHRLLDYHAFFLTHVSSQDTVLDIGCNNGAVTYDIAKKAKRVVGIDIDERNIETAKRTHSKDNITYVIGDATKDLGAEVFDVIIISNVLEHIEHRVEFLKKIKPLAKKFLIRVPMFNRDWIPLYKKELGVEWRLDLTHYTEFTEPQFRKEISESGYAIESLSIQFGEIWAVIS